MSSSSASSSGAFPSQAPAGVSGGVKGDNPEGDQGGSNSSVSQPQPSQSVNQPQPSQSVNKAYSYGPSSQRQAAGQMKDDGQEGGAQGDRKPSVSDFHNLDFSGHFKIKLLSRKDKPSVLKLKVNEEQFVKFRHLFHSELQLEALEQALLSDLKVAVTGDGYPPSICPQEGASHPIDISINRVLTSLCYQLNAVNISSTSWHTDQVKNTLFLLDSYQKGIVIGYEVSGDVTNCWLVGERGAIKTTMEALGQQLVPFRYQQTDQQEPNVKETTSDNRPTAQTRSDNKQTGQSGSDNNQTAQTGLDNRQTSQTDLDRQKRPSGVNADIERSGSENKPLEQVESNIRCLGLPESGDRQSGQSGSSQSETDNITGEQLAPNVMDTAQVLPGEPKDQIMDRSPDETDVHRTPFEYLPRGQGDRARGVNMSTSRTDDQSQPIDHPTRKEGDQPMTNFTATLELGRLPAKIWTSIQLMKDYEHKLKNIKLEDKSNGHCLHISGDKGTVDRVSTDIRNQLDQIARDRVDLSSVMRPEQMSMLRVSGVLGYVKDHIRCRGMSCYLEQDKDTTRVYATQDYISDILKEIQVAIFCQEFEIDSKWRLFVHSPYVQQDIINLQKYYNDKVTITVTESLVIIVCTSDISEEVLKAINKMKSDFSEAKAKTLPYIPHGHMTVELCAKVLHDQLNSAREKYGVEISPIRNKDKQGWIVKGPAGTLEEACEDVKKRTAKVVSKSVHLKEKVCKEFFESKPGQDEMLRVGEDTGTLVTIEKMEVSMAEEKHLRKERSGSTRQRTLSLTGRQWRSGDNPYIALYCGDGRESPDDVLVELKQGDARSSVKFRPRSDKHIAVTLNLPAWKGGENQEKYLITTQFKEIITAAAERRVSSLTILLDSCKDNGWHHMKACKLFVKNTVHVLQHDNAEACSCSYFTSDQEMFKLLRDMIDRSYKGDKLLSVRDIEEDEHDYEMMDISDAERKPNIVEGELANMTSEVIVNTTGIDLKLDQGAVSQSILKAAGRGIQRECDQYYGGVKHGEVAVTHGCKLKCTYVFHGALPFYKTDRMDEMKVLEQFMRHCLLQADKRKCRTISFPALGTGNLGYPKDKVAHTMFDTVKKFFQENPDSCVEDVIFVVYPKDRETVKAFQEEDKKRNQRKNAAAEVPKVTKPPLEKTGLQLKIGTFDLWMTLGQIDRAKADGLLIFWDAKSAYEKSGLIYFNEDVNPEGVNKFQEKRTVMMSTGEPIVTKAGHLPFKGVLHYPIKSGDIQLQNVEKALLVADDKNFSSLVLCLGKKEQWTAKSKTIIKLFHDALKQHKGRDNTLRSVEIIFDDPGIYKPVESHIRSHYVDKLVWNYSGTDANVAGATGGVSIQRDDNYNRSTGSPTGMAEETHLVVVSQTDDNMDKAIQQLQNKITELQRQPPDRPVSLSPTPTPPARRRKKQSGSKSPSPTSDTKDSASVVLIRTEYEKKRLIVTSKSHSALDKERIEDWLAKPTGIDVICPFRDETEALIIFTSMKDAQRMLDQHGNDAYLVAKFPKQTVQNVKAKLKSDIAEAIQTRVNGNAIYDASGATWLDDRGTCYLTGSLPEIQCAYKYIVSIITDGIRDDRFLDGRRPDDSGDPHGDTRGHDRLTKQGNQAQSRRPYGDATDGRENTTTATGGPTQSSQYDAEPEESDRSKNKVNACQTHVTSTKIKDPIQTKSRGHDNTIHIVKKHDDNESESSQQNDSKPSVNVGNLNGGNTRELTKEFFSPKQGSGVHDHYGKVQADPVSSDRNQRQQKVSKGHLAGEDMVEEGDKIDFDNMSEGTFYSSEMDQGTLKETGQHNQKGTYPDHVDERETLSCPSEQYIEIVYFNEGIDNGLEVKFSTNQNECDITGQLQNFRDAKDRHRLYARREIKTLTDTELRKFDEYYQRQTHAMHSKGILCKCGPSRKEIKLIGKNSDAVEETERRILTVIGRVSNQSSQQLSNVDSGKKKRMPPPSGSEVLKSSGGIQVFMYQGDLLNLDVDVIIHGTNSKLENSRGLSAQISQAAGPELETACKTVYAERRLNVADACFTTAGNLHYRCVIHVVVPRWPEYKKSGTDQSTRRKLYHDDLGRAILNALDEACNIGAKSVALPAIGCAKCPSDIFPAAFGEALHCFLETDKVTPLRQIHVVDQSNQDILNKIKFELVRKSHSTDKQKSPEKFRDEAGAQHISGSKTHPSKWKKCSTTGRTCMLSPKLRVTIKEGKYIQTQASALVSIEDEDLQSARYVAKEIAKAAGDQYRKMMEQLRKKGIKYQISDVFDTYAGDIRNAKHVLHVIGPVADTDIVGNKDLFKALAGNIRACIFRVLNKVVEMELDSVALPSFTSGTFEQGQTEKVWELCVDVVKKYAADQSVKSSLKEIILVAGHHDVQLLLKLFESKMPHYGTVV